MQKSVVSAITVAVWSLALAAPVAAGPLDAKASLLPTGWSFLGAEIELSPHDAPWAIGGTLTSLDYFPYPADAVVWGRTTAVHPQERPAWGLLAGFRWSQGIAYRTADGTPFLNVTYPGVTIGGVYQQSWHQLWWRLAPSLTWMANYDLPNPPWVHSFLLGPPLLEVGYQLGHGFEISLRSTNTPFRFAWVF